MQRRPFLLGCGCLAFAAAVGVRADEYDYQVPPRFARPEAGTDEGGLWAFMDREEQRLKRSSFLIRDPALHDYVNRIACGLAGEHCPEMRVYLVRTPYFNASMAPNGMMQVWSGLLVRMQNEAQLAAVLGHEIGHYLQRHSVERLRDAKSRSSFGLILGMALGAVGGGSVGALAQLGVLAGGLAYGRDQEREADRIGISLMARNSYAPAEAGRVWGQLLEEYEGAKAAGDEVSSTNILFASHPPAEERREVLATAAKRDWPGATRLGADEYRAVLAPHRMGFLQDEVRRRRFGESLVLFDRLLKSSPRDGQVQYFKGEAYRQRGREGDSKLALEAYRAALEMDNTPPDVHRSLGTVLRQTGDNAEATRAFQRYLELKPGAEDAELIRSYLTGGQS
ncbi:MAG TPA: M48 family metalloprotease [Burkholderiales bacterium]